MGYNLVCRICDHFVLRGVIFIVIFGCELMISSRKNKVSPQELFYEFYIKTI